MDQLISTPAEMGSIAEHMRCGRVIQLLVSPAHAPESPLLNLQVWNEPVQDVVSIISHGRHVVSTNPPDLRRQAEQMTEVVSNNPILQP